VCFLLLRLLYVFSVCRRLRRSSVLVVMEANFHASALIAMARSNFRANVVRFTTANILVRTELARMRRDNGTASDEK
jgi:hypothetical protein